MDFNHTDYKAAAAVVDDRKNRISFDSENPAVVIEMVWRESVRASVKVLLEPRRIYRMSSRKYDSRHSEELATWQSYIN